MHELALSQSIVDTVLVRARQEGVRKVTRVVLELGAAAGVESDALIFCFDVVTRETLAHGAELAVERVALRGKCRLCDLEFEPGSIVAPCPHCGASAPVFVAGQELRIKSFEGE